MYTKFSKELMFNYVICNLLVSRKGRARTIKYCVLIDIWRRDGKWSLTEWICLLIQKLVYHLLLVRVQW